MLKDSYKRKHTYLRISVTDRCNLRCTYCMPADGIDNLDHLEVFRNEEFLRLINIFVEMGIEKIRFTGGEPFVRRGFIDLARETRKRYPQLDLAVTTNGLLLHNYLKDLYEIGVKRLNISLDSISHKRYKELTGFDVLDRVLENIDSALFYTGFNVKVNVVLFQETLEELPEIINYFKMRNVTLRFIERMPFTEMIKSDDFVSSESLIKELNKLGSLVEEEISGATVSTNYKLNFSDGEFLKIGIIPAISHKFCNRCNRLRLSSDGLLKTCLHSAGNYDLKEVMRSGESDEALRKTIFDALYEKQKEHTLDCISSDGGCSALTPSGNMSKIGG